MKHLTHWKLGFAGFIVGGVGFIFDVGIVRNLLAFVGSILLTVAWFWMMFYDRRDKDNGE